MPLGPVAIVRLKACHNARLERFTKPISARAHAASKPQQQGVVVALVQPLSKRTHPTFDSVNVPTEYHARVFDWMQPEALVRVTIVDTPGIVNFAPEFAILILGKLATP